MLGGRIVSSLHATAEANQLQEKISNYSFKALVRNFLILMNVRYIQAVAKWVATKLIKTISSTQLSLDFSVWLCSEDCGVRWLSCAETRVTWWTLLKSPSCFFNPLCPPCILATAWRRGGACVRSQKACIMWMGRQFCCHLMGETGTTHYSFKWKLCVGMMFDDDGILE